MNAVPVAGALPAAAPGGSEERLSLLFDAHHDRLYRLARRLTPNPDDALDLVQETFLKAAAAASSIPHAPGGQEAWLVRRPRPEESRAAFSSSETERRQ